MNRENVFLFTIKFILNFLIDLPLILYSALLKKLKFKNFKNHINFCAHITTEGIIFFNKQGQIFVDQSLTRYEINQINNNCMDFIKLLKFNKTIKNAKIKIDVNKFNDANHLWEQHAFFGFKR